MITQVKLLRFVKDGSRLSLNFTGGEAVIGCVMLIRGMPAGEYSASLQSHSYNSLVARSFVAELTDEY